MTNIDGAKYQRNCPRKKLELSFSNELLIFIIKNNQLVIN